MAKFLELALDTVDPRSTVAEFWAPVVGGRAVVNDPRYPADVIGDDRAAGHLRVPGARAEDGEEPRAPRRLRPLDRRPGRARGATVQLPAEESGFAWTVMLDPEGNEFCAFLRESCPPTASTGSSSTPPTPRRRPRWWGEAFGAEVERQRRARRRLVDAAPRHRRPRAHLGLRAGARAQDGQEPAPLGRRAAPSRSSSTAGATRLWDTPRLGRAGRPGGQRVLRVPADLTTMTG